MMTTEHKEDQPHIDVVTRSETTTGNDKDNGKKEVEATWVRKTTKKAPTFDMKIKYSWR